MIQYCFGKRNSNFCANAIDCVLQNYGSRSVSVSEELLDVVDAQDRVIGVKTRGEIHSRGLMHRAVHILLFNEAGRVFLQKRSLSKDENPGLWDTSAAGHVDSGEDYLGCALREIHEELGIEAGPGFEFLFKMEPCRATGNEHSKVFRYRHDGPLRLHSGEIDDGAWLEPKTLDERVAAGDPTLTQVLARIWRRYRETRSER